MGKQLGVNRVIVGTKIPHPCGDPTLPPEADKMLKGLLSLHLVLVIHLDRRNYETGIS
jgi:hypothetical protein